MAVPPLFWRCYQAVNRRRPPLETLDEPPFTLLDLGGPLFCVFAGRRKSEALRAGRRVLPKAVSSRGSGHVSSPVPQNGDRRALLLAHRGFKESRPCRQSSPLDLEQLPQRSLECRELLQAAGV